MSTGRRIGQFLLMMLLPAIAALWSVAVTDSGVWAWPWQPHTADLWAYREAARYLLEGRDFYHLEYAFPYLYPPIAAVLAIPLTLVPWPVAQLLWTLFNVAIIVAVLRHLRLGPPWLISFTATVAVLFLEPITSTLRFGQLGVVLMGLVILDAVDGPRLFSRGDKRVLPAGVLTGLAAGLKLTPAVFIVWFFLIGRTRQGLVALATFGATVVVGILVSPRWSPGYWLRLAGGDSGANPDAYGWIANISALSAVYRFTGVTTTGTVIGLGLSALLVAAGLVVAVLAQRAERQLLGVSMLGLVSSLANPIAWVHHLTWVLPLLVAGLRDQLAPLLRWTVLITALWCLTNPQMGLGGAPWAQMEINEYSMVKKVIAAGPDIVVMLMLLAGALTLRPPPTAATDGHVAYQPERALEEPDGEG